MSSSCCRSNFAIVMQRAERSRCLVRSMRRVSGCLEALDMVWTNELCGDE
jgi:hypothetical protein